MLDTQAMEWLRCDFCRRGTVVYQNELLRFRQNMPRKVIYCEVTVPIGRCGVCGLAHVDPGSDAAIRSEVERACEAAD
jgi:hypothetical protein